MKAFVFAVIVGLVGSVSVYAYLGVLSADLESELQSTSSEPETAPGASVRVVAMCGRAWHTPMAACGTVGRVVGVEYIQGGEDNTVMRVQAATGNLSGGSITVTGADRIVK